MSIKLLIEHHLEFLSLKGRYTGSSESTHVKIPHCGKSHVTAHLFMQLNCSEGFGPLLCVGQEHHPLAITQAKHFKHVLSIYYMGLSK